MKVTVEIHDGLNYYTAADNEGFSMTWVAGYLDAEKHGKPQLMLMAVGKQVFLIFSIVKCVNLDPLKIARVFELVGDDTLTLIPDVSVDYAGNAFHFTSRTKPRPFLRIADTAIEDDSLPSFDFKGHRYYAIYDGGLSESISPLNKNAMEKVAQAFFIDYVIKAIDKVNKLKVVEQHKSLSNP